MAKKQYQTKEDELKIPETAEDVNNSVENSLSLKEPDGIDYGDIGNDKDFAIEKEIEDLEPKELPKQALEQEDFNSFQNSLAPIKSNLPLSKTNQILANYQALRMAQAAKNQNLQNAGYLSAGNQIAQALAYGRGAKIGEGSEQVAALRKDAEEPVQDAVQNIKYGDEQELADPASSVSNFYRDSATAILKKLYPNRSEDEIRENLKDLSALQIQKIPGLKQALGNLGSKPNLKHIDIVGADGKAHAMVVDLNDPSLIKDIGVKAYAQAIKNDPTTGLLASVSRSGGPNQATPVGLTNQKLSDSATEDNEFNESDLNKLNPKLYKDRFIPIKKEILADPEVKRAMSVNSSVTSLLEKLKPDVPAEKIDAGLAGAIQQQSASITAGTNRVAASITDKYKGTGGLAARFNRALENNVNGTMTEEDRDMFVKYAKDLQIAAQMTANDAAQKHIENLRGVGFTDKDGNQIEINDSNARKLLNIDSLTKNSYIDRLSNQNQSVKMQLPDGRIVPIKKDKVEQAKKAGAVEVKQ